MLDSYIPLERALYYRREWAEREQREFVNSLRQGLHEGKKFSELVRSHGTLFPTYYANLIESGEETGCLPDVVRELHKFMGESKELKDFIVSSSIYPVAILSIVLTVTILLFTVFVPRFAKIFVDMGRELPPAMAMLVGWRHFASWLVADASALAGVVSAALGRPGGAEVKFSRSSQNSAVRAGSRGSEMCKYHPHDAILLANHVEIIRTSGFGGFIANPVVSHAFGGSTQAQGARSCRRRCRNPLCRRERCRCFRVGEESGTREMLEKIATHLKSDTRLRIKRLLSLV